MNDPLRLFFALPCPADQAQAIGRWRDEQGLDGRAVPLANLHLTLAFLGAQPADALAEIARLGESIHAEAFELRLDRLISSARGSPAWRQSSRRARLATLSRCCAPAWLNAGCRWTTAPSCRI